MAKATKLNNKKQAFGVRKTGKAKKKVGPKEKHEKKYRSQGR
jgi:hypothetical protein